jgi:hypothetical protein
LPYKDLNILSCPTKVVVEAVVRAAKVVVAVGEVVKETASVVVIEEDSVAGEVEVEVAAEEQPTIYESSGRHFTT